MLPQYISDIEQARVILLETYASIPNKLVARQGCWSAREILYHLYKTELGIAKIFRAGQRVATMHPKKSNAELQSEREGLSEVKTNRSVKIIAPDTIQPIDMPADADVCALLEQSRAMLVQYISTRNDEELRSMSFTHPVRGMLTLYGWITFVAVHELRHTEQMKELL